MGTTALGLAQQIYGAYQLSQSSSYSTDMPDTSTISKEYYGITDVSAANEALSKSSEADFAYLPRVDGFAEQLFQTSQLQNIDVNTYDVLKSTLGSSSIGSILSGSSDSSVFLKTTDAGTDAALAYAENQISSPSSSGPVNSYQSYLNSTSVGNILDTYA